MKRLPKITLGQKPTYITIAEGIDIYEVFQKIEQTFNTCFLFESLGEEGKFSRYSIVGFDPQQTISARGEVLKIDKAEYKVANPYYSLRQIMPQQTFTREYAGGLVGYLNYDAINYFEQSLRVKVHDTFEQFCFGVYTDGLIYDKLTDELQYFYYDTNRMPMIQSLLRKTQNQIGKVEVKFLKDSATPQEHSKVVSIVKKNIRAGNTFQCEVGFKSKYSIKGDTLLLYERLRKVNPSPFMYYFKFGSSTGSRQVKKIIGASPELLFSLRDGEMTTKPLAGTIARGRTIDEDKKLAKKLLHDEKEIAEHNMLVDLHRSDIGKVAQFGTVRIKELGGIKKFSHVQHIASEIVGLIKNGEDMFSGLAANFPAGTLSGAPKIESMKIIDANEKEARGPYGGGVGSFGFNGDCTFAIAIRSLFISGENAYAQTSGGIVADSDPEKEYDEIQQKLAAMKKVLTL